MGVAVSDAGHREQRLGCQDQNAEYNGEEGDSDN